MTQEDSAFEALTATGRAKRTTAEKKKAAHDRREKAKAQAYRRAADQRAVVAHVQSTLASALPLALGSSLLLGGVVLLMVGGSVGNGWLLVGAAVCVGLLGWGHFRGHPWYVRRALLKEKAWIDAKPFRIRAYPDLFVYRSYPCFRMTLRFAGDRPSKQDVLHALSTLPFEIRPKDDQEGGYTFEVCNPAGSKFHGQRRWARRWIHQALDHHVMAVHEAFPIAEVVFGEGKTELTFDWTVPRDVAWWR